MAVLFGLVSLFTNPMLMLIAVFVWVGATQESAEADLKTHFDGAHVRDAMLTHFRTLNADQTLAEAARHLLAGSQQDFPVLENGQLSGILLRPDLLEALQSSSDTTPIGQVMRRDFDVVNDDELLDSALAGARERGTTMAVLRNGQLAGLLTAENVGEFYMIRAALAKAKPAVARAEPEGSIPPVIAELELNSERAQRAS